jgi:hypothetical protein
LTAIDLAQSSSLHLFCTLPCTSFQLSLPRTESPASHGPFCTVRSYVLRLESRVLLCCTRGGVLRPNCAVRSAAQAANTILSTAVRHSGQTCTAVRGNMGNPARDAPALMVVFRSQLLALSSSSGRAVQPFHVTFACSKTQKREDLRAFSICNHDLPLDCPFSPPG